MIFASDLSARTLEDVQTRGTRPCAALRLFSLDELEEIVVASADQAVPADAGSPATRPCTWGSLWSSLTALLTLDEVASKRGAGASATAASGRAASVALATSPARRERGRQDRPAQVVRRDEVEDQVGSDGDDRGPTRARPVGSGRLSAL